MALAISRTAAFGRSNPWRVRRIDEIHVHRDVNPSRVHRSYLNRFGDNIRKSPVVQLAHREDANTHVLDELALAGIDAASADHCDVLRQYLRREARDVSKLASAFAQQRGERHPVYVPCR